MKTIHIKSFKFGFACYHLSDGCGDEILLNVNYYDNQFSIKSKTKIKNKKFRAEAATIATDLLSRKHGTEFANK